MNKGNTKRNFEEIFVSTFHNKLSFKDFLELDVQSQFQEIQIKNRIVYAPKPKLKLIHRFINNTILEFADFNSEVVFSYRKGTSTRHAVEKHAKNHFYFQTDFSNFYNNICADNVHYALQNQLTSVPISDVNDFIDRILELVVVDNHVPAGFSTSPLLSNICLFKFDNELNQYCKKNQLTYTRYSDDLIISSETDTFFDEIESVINDLLTKNVNNNISINHSKTKFHKKGNQFTLLGFNILPNGVVTIPSSDKKMVESLIYLYLTDNNKFLDCFKNNIALNKVEPESKLIREQAIGTLSGKLIAFNSMDKQYISKLRHKYGNTVIDMFIRKSVK